MKETFKRWSQPTPPFFRKISAFGMTLVAASTVIISSPIQLSSQLTDFAGYTCLAGGILTATSQLVTSKEK